MDAHRFTHLALRKLDGVITKLEPLAEENALLKFIRNVNNAKILSGFVRELADAVEYYQVWARTPSVIFNEHPARFLCNKECMKGQGRSMTTPRIFKMIPRTSW